MFFRSSTVDIVVVVGVLSLSLSLPLVIMTWSCEKAINLLWLATNSHIVARARQ